MTAVIFPPDAEYVPAAPLPSIPLNVSEPLLCKHPVPPAPMEATIRSVLELQPTPPSVTVGAEVYPLPPEDNVTVEIKFDTTV